MNNHFKFINKKLLYKGTTLIELLLYIGLLSVFIGLLTGLFGTAMEIFLSSQSSTGISTDSTYILSRLTYDVQRAQSIATPELPGNSSSSLTLVIDGINYTYASDSNGNLIYTNNLGNFNLNSHLVGVSDIQFTKVGNSGGIEDTIKIEIKLLSRVEQPKGNDEETISTTIAIHRN